MFQTAISVEVGEVISPDRFVFLFLLMWSSHLTSFWREVLVCAFVPFSPRQPKLCVPLG